MDFFASGRTEIIGNHTDHQLGRVIASAVGAGISAGCERTEDNILCLGSEGFGQIKLSLDDLEPRPEERGTAAALARGMAWAMKKRGLKTGGFCGFAKSGLRPGGGLSSSAAFTVLIGKIFNGLYNGGGADALTLARCAREAENLHFGKPSGLMDQLACAIGSAVYIDFLSGEIQELDCDFAGMGLALCLTDTGGSHASLSGDYAAITEDMLIAAHWFGEEKLGYVNPNDFFSMPPREGEPYLRAKHFFEENDRVPRMRDAILRRDAEECVALMNASGRSSEEQLKNILPLSGDDRLARGLELSAKLLEGVGAWRVHGGGFAGCVQALMPDGYFENYQAVMDARFGAGSCNKIM